MVKSQGANVAPREVELFLEEHFAEVLYAFVLGMPHPELGEEVTAVLVPAQGRTIDPDDLTAPRPRADLRVQGADPHRGVGRGRRAVARIGQARQAGDQERRLELPRRERMGAGLGFSRTAHRRIRAGPGSDPRRVEDAPAAVLTYLADADANSIAWLVWQLSRSRTITSPTSPGPRSCGPRRRGTNGSRCRSTCLRPATGTAATRWRRSSCVELLLGYHDAVPRDRGPSPRAQARRPRPDRRRALGPARLVGVRLVSVVDDDLEHAGQAAFVRGLAERYFA